MHERTTWNSHHDIESTEKAQEIPNEPFRVCCEGCVKEVTTFIKIEYNIYLALHTILVFFFYGFFYGVILIAISFSLFKNITHTCPNCMTVLFEKQFYPINIKENFISIQYGKCVWVWKTIYIVVLLTLILWFGLFLNIQHYSTNQAVAKQNWKTKTLSEADFIKNLYDPNAEWTWDELLKDCGARVMVENNARAKEIFNRKYFKKKILWSGYFLSAFVHPWQPFEYNTDHWVNWNIRMIPSETLKSQDLVWSMGHRKYKDYANVLQQWKTGTPVKFTATFESIGDEWQPHHLHMIGIEIIKDFIDNNEKIVLFKGVNFDISGHLKIQKEVEKVEKILPPRNNTTDEGNNPSEFEANSTVWNWTLDDDYGDSGQDVHEVKSENFTSKNRNINAEHNKERDHSDDGVNNTTGNVVNEKDIERGVNDKNETDTTNSTGSNDKDDE